MQLSTIVCAAIVLTSSLFTNEFAAAQSPSDQSHLEVGASAIVARMREVRTTSAQRSAHASISNTAFIKVLEDRTKFDLIKPQTAIHERIGAYHRDPEVGAQIRLVAARSTAPPTGISRGVLENIQTFGEVGLIDENEIILLNTAMPSPLSSDADRFYTFTLAGVQQRNGVDVDVVRFIPTTALRPLFTGSLFIAREKQGARLHSGAGAGELLAIDLEPSPNTVLPFVDAISITQSFVPVDGIMMPDSLIIRGTATVAFVTLGIAETQLAFSHVTRLRDHQADIALPDSFRNQSSRIFVSDDAANAPDEFWLSRTSLSNEQIAIIEESHATYDAARRTIDLLFGGMIDYNRAGGVTTTASAGAAYGPLMLAGSGGYSFGLKHPVGDATMSFSLASPTSFVATARTSVFSQIATTSTGDKTYPRIMGTLVAATLHQDYYNYMRKDGWNAGVDLAYGKLRFATTFEQSRQFSIGNNASWSLLTWNSKTFPENPPVTEGQFTTMQAELAFSRVSPFLKLTPAGDDDFRWSISGMHGTHDDSNTSFDILEALASYSIPVARTGYNPVTVTLLGAAGAASAVTPPQYQFRLRTSAATFGKPGGFVSPPKGLYGGNEYVAIGTEINLTDLPWRAIGLPTVNGRGLELIIAGGAARYRQAHSIVVDGEPLGFVGTGDGWYTEAGLALSRIPLFLTEVVYGRVDVRKGFGPLGKFGVNFTFVLPL